MNTYSFSSKFLKSFRSSCEINSKTFTYTPKRLESYTPKKLQKMYICADFLSDCQKVETFSSLRKVSWRPRKEKCQERRKAKTFLLSFLPQHFERRLEHIPLNPKIFSSFDQNFDFKIRRDHQKKFPNERLAYESVGAYLRYYPIGLRNAVLRVSKGYKVESSSCSRFSHAFVWPNQQTFMAMSIPRPSIAMCLWLACMIFRKIP